MAHASTMNTPTYAVLHPTALKIQCSVRVRTGNHAVNGIYDTNS